jgi:hypothetical protein
LGQQGSETHPRLSCTFRCYCYTLA